MYLTNPEYLKNNMDVSNMLQKSQNMNRIVGF